VECPQANSSNQFYLTIDSWGIVFAGKAKDVGMKPTNGGRAIAYLLKVGTPKVGTPKGGPAEVWSAMVPDGQQVLAEAREEFGAQEVADSRTLVTVRQQLKEVEEKLELEDVQVEEREKLEDEKAGIESYLAGVERLGGGSRTWGGRGAAPAVGETIRRAMKMLEKIHPELHTHLKDAIKEQYGQNVRYVRAKGMPHWNVRVYRPPFGPRPAHAAADSSPRIGGRYFLRKQTRYNGRALTYNAEPWRRSSRTLTSTGGHPMSNTTHAPSPPHTPLLPSMRRRQPLFSESTHGRWQTGGHSGAGHGMSLLDVAASTGSRISKSTWRRIRWRSRRDDLHARRSSARGQSDKHRGAQHPPPCASAR
jgi:hypothetical protein